MTNSKTSFWQKIGLHEWFLKKDNQKQEVVQALTSNEVFHYLLQKFKESIQQLSFANRIVFFHEYIISFSGEDYRDFMENKKGIFGLIVNEAVKEFYEVLKSNREQGKIVVPSSSKWVFRFVSHPDYAPGDMGFIGKLLPDSSAQKDENLRVTYIPRQTGIAQTFDINPEILKGFYFYSEGYYEIPYQEKLENTGKAASSAPGMIARLETFLPDKAFAGKKLEYLMKENEITVSGSEAKSNASGVFRIPSEWVNTPHLRIRFSNTENKLYLAAFGEKTIVNEKEIKRSNEQNPDWNELPFNSKIVLNGIVGINIFKA